ncbi:MAG: YajQ family cyclic di-GMP-binding protein [Deltaproteobacteria bacterium]|nr:YajQ family cyclic di-GMP-binding protein [Deltaproteobacteria bacterium]
MPSFDIVCEIQKQELDNAVHQALKEIGQRFDFKNAGAQIKLEDKTIVVTARDEYKVKAAVDVLKSKLVKRGISLKVLQEGPIEPTALSFQKQVLTLQQGIPAEKAKEIVKSIKQLKLKVQSQIQGDQVRISGPKIDDLQSIIQMLKTNDHEIHMDFVNMKRD